MAVTSHPAAHAARAGHRRVRSSLLRAPHGAAYLRVEISKGVAAMQCPVDGTQLVMTERSGVEIDYCPQCRGVWLDRGELDKIIDRGAAQAAGQPRGRRTQACATTIRTGITRGATARRSARAFSVSSLTSKRSGAEASGKTVPTRRAQMRGSTARASPIDRAGQVCEILPWMEPGSQPAGSLAWQGIA